MHIRSPLMLASAVLVVLLGCEKEPLRPVQITNSRASTTIGPYAGAVSIFSTPGLEFTRPLEEEAPQRTENYGELPIRASLEYLRVISNGTEVAGTLVWAEDRKSVHFVPTEILPLNTRFRMESSIRYEAQRDGEWVPATFQGSPTEVRWNEFTTVEEDPDVERLTLALSVTDGQTGVSPAMSLGATVGISLSAELSVWSSPFPLRAELEDLALYQGQERVAGSLRAEEPSGTQRTFDPEPLLPPNQQARAELKVRWARKVKDTWTPIPGTTQTREATFTVADYDPRVVHVDNLATAYPIPRQLYFHPLEYSEGHLRLKRPQPALVAAMAERELVVRFNRPSGTETSVPATYSPDTRTFHFPIQQTLFPATIYTLQLVAVGDADERILFEAPFRTSRFATFSDKWDEVSLHPTKLLQTNELIWRYLSSAEQFDAFETQHRGGLIQAEAVWEGNAWYDSYFRQIYAGLESGKVRLIWERPRDLAVPPQYPAYVSVSWSNRKLLDAEIAADAIYRENDGDDFVEVRHNALAYFRRDLEDLREQALLHPERETDPWIRELTQGTADKGSYANTVYRVQLKYMVPGQTAPTTVRFVDIDNTQP